MTKKIGFTFLGGVALFLVLGNLTRIDFFAASMGSGNLSELVLYIFAIFCAYIVSKRLFNCQLFLILTSGVIFSLLVGLVKWGIDATAISYNVRLILQIITSAVTGVFLYERYSDNVRRFIGAYLFLYGVIVALSYLIFLAFPDTGTLLATLGEAGIEFRGDAHVDRLVSTYLDPNYFSIIIVLPIIFWLYSFLRNHSLFGGLFGAIALGALFLTVSRSGLSLFLLFSIVLLAGNLLELVGSFRLKKSFIFIMVTFLFGTSLLLVVDSPFLNRITDRFTNISSDGSALERFDSFNIGMELLTEEPLLGYGYNYSVRHIIAIRGIGLPGLDSSLQGVLVNFGLIPSLCLTILLLLWWTRVNLILKKYGGASDVYSTWRLVTIYIVLSLLWAANFNPVLLYPFWLVPILSILMYFGFIANGKKRFVTMRKSDLSSFVSGGKNENSL